MRLLFVVVIVVAILAVMFALQNAVPVSIMLFAWRIDSSLALVLLLALALGALLGALVSVPTSVRRRWAIGRQRKRIAELEQQLQAKDQQIAEFKSSASAAPGSVVSDATTTPTPDADQPSPV